MDSPTSSMPQTLFLTDSEKTMFEGLDSSAKEGWDISEETLTFSDTEEYRKIRLELLRVHDPKLQELQKKALEAKTSEEMEELIAHIELQDLPEDDLMQLFFAMGPDVLTSFIKVYLEQSKMDDDLEAVCALTSIRHALLDSLQSL